MNIKQHLLAYWVPNRMSLLDLLYTAIANRDCITCVTSHKNKWNLIGRLWNHNIVTLSLSKVTELYSQSKELP